MVEQVEQSILDLLLNNNEFPDISTMTEKWIPDNLDKKEVHMLENSCCYYIPDGEFFDYIYQTNGFQNDVKSSRKKNGKITRVLKNKSFKKVYKFSLKTNVRPVSLKLRFVLNEINDSLL